TGDASILELGLDAQADPTRTGPAPGDVRIVVTVFNGEPVALLYRYRAPGTTNAVVFASDGASVSIDQVTKIDGAEVKLEPYERSSGKTLALSAKIPWKDLTDTPPKLGPQVELRGDVGFVIGNAAGTAALQR